MGYREMIKKVQLHSGFSDSESKEALESTVEAIAVHLTERGRMNFAAQLPQKLQDMVLAVWATEDNSKQDLLEQIMRIQDVSKDRAKQQLLSAWEALKDAISPGEIEKVRAQLPNVTVALLH